MTIKSIRTGWTGISALAGNDQWFSDFESIASVTVGEGGTSTIQFTSIPSTYQHLQIRWIARTNRGTFGFDDLRITFNNDSSALYTFHQLWGDGTNANSGADINQTYGLMYNTAGTGVSGTWWAAAVCDVLDYANTNKFKTVRTLNGVDLNGNAVGGLNGRVNLASNLWRSTTAVNRIDLVSNSSSNFQQHSHFALYGIRG
jgi:hypothetical protein